MSQTYRRLKGLGFRPQLDTNQYTPSQIPYGQDDPLLEEAQQNQLEKFLETFRQSQMPKAESCKPDNLDGHVSPPRNGHLLQRSGPSKLTKSKPSSTRESSAGTPRKLPSIAPTPSTTVRTRSMESPSYTSTPSTSRAPLSPNHKFDTPATIKSSPPTQRRSGRTKSGPANYYKKLRIGDSDSDEERSRVSPPPPSYSRTDTPQSSSHSSTAPSHTPHVIYSSYDYQITQSTIKSLDDLHLENACYSQGNSAAFYYERFRDNPEEKVLHVDFDQHEITALLNIMSFYGYQCPPNAADMPLTDQIINGLSTHQDPQGLVENISWMCKLVDRLPKDMDPLGGKFLMERIESIPNKKKVHHAKLLLNKILHIGDDYEDSSLQSIQPRLDQLPKSLSYASALKRRTPADILSFITKARMGDLPTVPSIIQGQVSESGCRTIRRSNLNGLLKSRELGTPVKRKLRTCVNQDFRLSKTWKGASNDVIVLAWSPSGTQFAAGATAQCDEHNMIYNRGNNLVFGDLTKGSLRELPDHNIERPPTTSQTDPRLFMSVTAIQWFEDTLFTASYDKTVKLWDVSHNNKSGPVCFETLRHNSKVQVMARSNFDQDTLATGANSFGLWNIKDASYAPLELPRHKKELVPTSLAWGTTPAAKNILVAGMSEALEDVARDGLLAAWQINEATVTHKSLMPNSQNIFDIQWHPSLPQFVAATSAQYSHSRSKDKSFVRLYEPLTNTMQRLEMGCPALDINDVTFCPTASNYITASCTDGITYVWDCRQPMEILHTLQHGKPLNQIDENLTREQADVGVRMALWGDGVDQFYTGASDGVVKKWDILRSPEDVHVKDMVQFQEEIMSGTFSKDKSNLLIGDAAGAVHVLSSNSLSDSETHNLKFERSSKQFESEPESGESGAKRGHRLLKRGRLLRHPIFGVGQGPYYKGPYAAWARPEGTTEPESTPLSREVQIRQLATQDRQGLDEGSLKEVEAQIRLAQARNQKRGVAKRKRIDSTKKSTSFINVCSDDEDTQPPISQEKIKKRAPKATASINAEPVIIDLTMDTETDTSSDAEMGSGPVPVRSGIHDLSELQAVIENLEEDFWWPESGKIDPNLDGSDF